MIGEEFIKIFSLLQNLVGCDWKNPNDKNEIHNFILKYMTVNSRNTKRIYANNTENKLIGNNILIKDNLIIRCYNSMFHEEVDSIIVKKKVKISGHLYGSTDKNNKHRDDCFVTKDGKFAGLIKYVMEKYHSIYFISVKLDYEQPFCSDFQPFLKSDISLARKSNEVLIFRSNYIKKIGLFQV